MREVIEVLAIFLAIAVLMMVANVLQQRYYCKQAWRDCSPVALISCEPVSKIEAQWRDYEERAKQQPREGP